MRSDFLQWPDELDADDLDGEDIGLGSAPDRWVGALAGALHERYDDVLDEEVEWALEDVMGSLSEAESISLGKALARVADSAVGAVRSPTVASLAPIAGTTLGGALGGPAGASLGASAARALAGAGGGSARTSARPTPNSAPTPSAVTPSAAATGGSTAAAQALLLTQNPDVLRALLALSLGTHGRSQVQQVPVRTVVKMLSDVFGQALADAEELSALEAETSDTGWGEDVDPAWDADRFGAFDDDVQRLYEHLVMGGRR